MLASSKPDYFYCKCPIMLALAFNLQSEQTAVFSLLQKKSNSQGPRMTVPRSLFICDYIQSTCLLLHSSLSQHHYDNSYLQWEKEAPDTKSL